MVIEKGILTTAGVVLAGFVGYKIIKKKKPEWIEKTKESIAKTKDNFGKLIEGAKASFQEGYASA